MPRMTAHIGRLTASGGKGMNRAPKLVYTFTTKQSTGLPKGREPYGNRVLIVVRGKVMLATWRRRAG